MQQHGRGENAAFGGGFEMEAAGGLGGDGVGSNIEFTFTGLFHDQETVEADVVDIRAVGKVAP